MSMNTQGPWQLDRYRLLGRSGLRVSPLCLGTMTFGTEWGWGADRETSRAIFNAYAERGGNFIDTANFYTKGTSERLVGECMADARERFVLATKFTLNMRPGDPNAGGNHRKCMIQSVEASLRRLNTDYIDLYWLHAWDGTTPVDEVMRGLDDLVRAGKILYVAVSDTPAWKIAQCNTLAELRGWSRFIALQVEYNLALRDVERDLVPMAIELGLGVLPWSPLASGLLSGKYTRADLEKQGNAKAEEHRRRRGGAAHRPEREAHCHRRGGEGRCRRGRALAGSGGAELAAHPAGRHQPDPRRAHHSPDRGQSRCARFRPGRGALRTPRQTKRS